MKNREIIEELISRKDEDYRVFQSALIPGVNGVIGVRMADVRAIAKKYSGMEAGNVFLLDLPHTYLEENMVHSLIIGNMRGDRNIILKSIETFAPYIDNWAVCDSFVSSLKYFFRDRKLGLDLIFEQIGSGKAYQIRFGLVALLNYYIDDEYVEVSLGAVRSVRSDEYYVKMAQAWLISVAIAKQYEKSVRILEDRELDIWVHNKSIQKSKESYRVSKERKEYLDSLRIKRK